MVLGKTGARQERFNASALIAITGISWAFVIAIPGKWIVPPLPSHRINPLEKFIAHNTAAADAQCQE
jgi:hypothetical protein